MFETYRKTKWSLLQNQDTEPPYFPVKIDISINEVESYYKKNPSLMVDSFDNLKKEKHIISSKHNGMQGIDKYLNFPIKKSKVENLSVQEKIDLISRKCPGWNMPEEINFLKDIAESYLKVAKNIVELGSFSGKSASVFGSVYFNTKVKIHCIDRWDMDVRNFFNVKNIKVIFAMLYDQFLKWTYWFRENLNIIRWNSWKSAEFFKDKSIDIIFIDAGHLYEEVLMDIISWLPKVKPYGIIVGHDYSDSHPGVKLAVKKVFGNKFDRGPGGIWYKIL